MDKKILKKCLICGKHFYYYKSSKKDRKCCSIACSAKYKKKIGHKPPVKIGKEHYRWKGGKDITNQGYYRITVNGKRVLEHRYLMEKKIGRKLFRYEHIHHIDGNKLNNNIENLLLVSPRQHQNIHHKK